MNGKVMVVVPTYNEADNLPTLVGELLALDVPGLEILIVDDNSPDGTGQVADDLAERHPGRVHVIHRPGKQGLGTAYVTGFGYALDQGADYIVQMDADFSHSPQLYPPVSGSHPGLRCGRRLALCVWRQSRRALGLVALLS